MSGHITHRTHHFIGDYERAFAVVIQRKRLKGQANLDMLKSDKEV